MTLTKMNLFRIISFVGLLGSGIMGLLYVRASLDNGVIWELHPVSIVWAVLMLSIICIVFAVTLKIINSKKMNLFKITSVVGLSGFNIMGLLYVRALLDNDGVIWELHPVSIVWAVLMLSIICIVFAVTLKIIKSPVQIR